MGYINKNRAQRACLACSVFEEGGGTTMTPAICPLTRNFSSSREVGKDTISCYDRIALLTRAIFNGSLHVEEYRNLQEDVTQVLLVLDSN